MHLKGQRCTLRLWQSNDVTSLVRHANNIKIAKQLRDRFPHPYTRSNATAFLNHCQATDPPTNFAIDVGGEAVGGIGLVAGTDVERFAAEVGYWLAEPYWGRGIATDALLILTEHAFEHMNLLRLFALPFADNERSTRVLEKVGYVKEGILRSSCVKYGQPRDQALYARVNPRWKGVPTG